MNRILLIVIGNWLALSACAGDIDVASSSPLKVDLNNVVETGVVRPVNGITAAGQPDEAALAVFAKNGYVAVLDLRTAGEDRGLDEKAVVEGLGMDYVLFPVDRDGISFENATALDEANRQPRRADPGALCEFEPCRCFAGASREHQWCGRRCCIGNWQSRRVEKPRRASS